MKFCSIFKTLSMHLSGIHIKIIEERLVMFSGPYQSIEKLRDADSRSWRELSEHEPQAYFCCLCTVNGITLLLTSTSVCDRHSLRSMKMWWLRRIIERFEQLWMVDTEKTKQIIPAICILVVPPRHNEAEKRNMHRSLLCDVWVALESFQQCIRLSGTAPSLGWSSLSSVAFFH